MHIWDSVVENGPCNPGYQACVLYTDVQGVHGNDTDYDKVTVNFNAADAIANGGKWLWLGNHELGHVVGLADPTPVPGPNQDAEQCLINVDVAFLGAPFTTIPVPVASVMHERRCPELTPGSDLFWPTIYDFISFDENVKPFP